MIKFIIIISITLFSIVFANAQNSKTEFNFMSKKSKLSENDLKCWSHLDIQKDCVLSMSVD